MSKLEHFEESSHESMEAIYTRAIRLTKNAPKAEELVQMTYQRAFDAYSEKNSILNFKKWATRFLFEIYIEQCARVKENHFRNEPRLTAS